MKKLFKLLLCALLLMSLIACNKKEDVKQENEQGISGLANPVHEYGSLEEINSVVGSNLVKPTIIELEDESYSVIDGDYPVAEYRFSNNGNKYCLRFSNVDETQDISGYYFDGPLFSETDVATTFANPKDGIKAVRWFADIGQYCLTVEGDIEFSEFSEIGYNLIEMIGEREIDFDDFPEVTERKTEIIEEEDRFIYVSYPIEEDEYPSIAKNIYECNGETITHVYTEMEFETEELAQAFFDIYNANYPSMGLVIDGKIVSYVISEDGSAYKDFTRNDIISSLQ